MSCVARRNIATLGRRYCRYSSFSPSNFSSSGFQSLSSQRIAWSLRDNWNVECLQPSQAILKDEGQGAEGGSLAEIIDGKSIARSIKDEISEEVSRMKSLGKVPGLAILLVGACQHSASYVRLKKKACGDVGIIPFGMHLPEDVSEDEVLKQVEAFNIDPAIHGILVQLPLPKHIDEERILAAIGVEKDVDGFHPLNIGKLAMPGRTPLFVPCSPRGCTELLLRLGVDIHGKHIVIIGRSNIEGTPLAMLLQRYQATVTVVHSFTQNPAAITRNANIVISAAGVAHLVRGNWIKPGAVVLDVGLNAIKDPLSKKGYRLVGDVCFEEVSRVASAITPVPGGVGPMTIAMLLSNTLDSAKRAFGFQV